jgi:hypothetical protein
MLLGKVGENHLTDLGNEPFAQLIAIAVDHHLASAKQVLFQLSYVPKVSED